MGRRKANQLKKSYRPEEFPREEAIGLSTRAVFFKVISKQRPLRLANFVLEGNSFSMTLLISSPLPLRCGANVDLEDYVEERSVNCFQYLVLATNPLQGKLPRY